MRVELELRNLPRFRVLEYLIELGGSKDNDLRVSGDGWHAALKPMPHARVGSLRVPRDLLVIEGDGDCVDIVHDHMRQKTMRGGG